jgi:ABC-type branched-subunit amino acid transport system ATPase component
MNSMNSSNINVLEASGLGKRYGSTWALRDCALAIPAGHVAALVGPNGAGKTTLLNLSVGLMAPSAGKVTVLGGRAPGSLAALDGVAFVAQDTPVYKNLSVADMLHLTRNLSRYFDQAYAQARLSDLGIPLKRKAGKLSGGQQAQLALTLALARRPQLLILDEPVAMLDPVARHDFMATVLTAAVDDPVPPGWEAHPVCLEELALAYLREPGAGAPPGSTLPGPTLPGPASWSYQPFLPGPLQVYNQAVPLDPGLFDLRGVAFAAWTLAAFSIGTLAGMLIRRAVPAIAATLACYTGLALATALYLRHHYPVQAVDQLPARHPVLAVPVDRGRLAARAVRAVHRRGRLAGPPPGELEAG